VLEVTVAHPGLLVVAEPWYPGWQVTLDGKPAANLRVDYALRGVPLAPGTHTVAWELRCPPLQAGAAVTMLALVAAATMVQFARASDRRRRRR